jgi:hypothetical protein
MNNRLPHQYLSCTFLSLVLYAGGFLYKAHGESLPSSATNEVIVATGELLSVDLKGAVGNFGMGVYRIREVLLGQYSGETAIVVFAQSTMVTNLPSNALLVLARKNFFLTALGLDVSKGILPNTAENRKKLEPLDQLPARLQAAMLTEADAQELALGYISRGASDLQILKVTRRRYPFCWFVSVLLQSADLTRGDIKYLIIGDDRKIVEVWSPM